MCRLLVEDAILDILGNLLVFFVFAFSHRLHSKQNLSECQHGAHDYLPILLIHELLHGTIEQHKSLLIKDSSDV